jgi:hypothetical protein
MSVLTCSPAKIDVWRKYTAAFRFDLSEALTLTLGNSTESNPYIENPISTNYVDNISLSANMSGPKNHIFASLNVRSLMSNHEQLSALLIDLVRNNVNLVAVALQEVWSVPYPELVKIPGFNLILNTRKNSRGGGVGFYIKENTDYIVG